MLTFKVGVGATVVDVLGDDVVTLVDVTVGLVGLAVEDVGSKQVHVPVG